MQAALIFKHPVPLIFNSWLWHFDMLREITLQCVYYFWRETDCFFMDSRSWFRFTIRNVRSCLCLLWALLVLHPYPNRQAQSRNFFLFIFDFSIASVFLPRPFVWWLWYTTVMHALISAISAVTPIKQGFKVRGVFGGAVICKTVLRDCWGTQKIFMH